MNRRSLLQALAITPALAAGIAQRPEAVEAEPTRQELRDQIAEQIVDLENLTVPVDARMIDWVPYHWTGYSMDGVLHTWKISSTGITVLGEDTDE